MLISCVHRLRGYSIHSRLWGFPHPFLPHEHLFYLSVKSLLISIVNSNTMGVTLTVICDKKKITKNFQLTASISAITDFLNRHFDVEYSLYTKPKTRYIAMEDELFLSAYSFGGNPTIYLK